MPEETDKNPKKKSSNPSQFCTNDARMDEINSSYFLIFLIITDDIPAVCTYS